MKTIEDRRKEANLVGLELVGEWAGVVAKTAYLCQIHGVVFNTPNKIQQGFGCPKCGRDSQFSKRRCALTTIANKANLVGLEYVSGFTNMNTPATYKCAQHGLIQMTPLSVNRGSVCKRCSAEEVGKRKRITRDQLEKKAKLVGLSLIGEFVDIKTPAWFSCEVHGKQKKKPENILSGRGCPSCAKTGFKPDLPAFFYVYLVQGSVKDFAGFGITADLKRRHGNHKATLAQHGMIGKIVFERAFERGADAMALEFSVKTKFKDQAQKNTVLGFKTEAIKVQHIAELVKFADSFKTNNHFMDDQK